MLTSDALESKNSGNSDRFNKDDFEMKSDKLVETALKVYHGELTRPSSIDLGLHSESRAKLRKLCQVAVLAASKTAKILSSVQSKDQDKNAISALRQLQKERLIVSRLGFAERAMELDKEIEVMRSKAKIARENEEHQILNQRMKLLAISHQRKQQRLEFILSNETVELEKTLAEEVKKMKKRQEEEFLRVIEGATRRAVGRAKRCNCLQPYVCRHNKTASYNTRRPTIVVVQYRRNGKRLKHNGRIEEGQAWEEKAKEIDEKHQERWRERIANSIVASPWGANEAIVDQITEGHKKELATLFKTQQFKRDQHNKRQAMRRKNFANTIMAEERKVRMQCRKQALLRVIKDFAKEVDEEKKQRRLGGNSDGLKNISKNIFGMGFDDGEREKVDWVPPTSAGLENSVRLVDALNEATAIDPNAITNTRILTSQKDIKKMSSDQIKERINKQLDVDQEDDEEIEESTASESSFGGSAYEMGKTSGSKLLDKMRKRVSKQQELKEINLAYQSGESPDKSVASTVPMGYMAPNMPNTPAPTFLSPRTTKLATGGIPSSTATPMAPYQFPGSNATAAPYSFPGSASPAPYSFGSSATSTAPYSFSGSGSNLASMPVSAPYSFGGSSNSYSFGGSQPNPYASSAGNTLSSNSVLEQQSLSLTLTTANVHLQSNTLQPSNPVSSISANIAPYNFPVSTSTPYSFPGSKPEENPISDKVTQPYSVTGTSNNIANSSLNESTVATATTTMNLSMSESATKESRIVEAEQSSFGQSKYSNNSASVPITKPYSFSGTNTVEATAIENATKPSVSPYIFPGSQNFPQTTSNFAGELSKSAPSPYIFPTSKPDQGNSISNPSTSTPYSFSQTTNNPTIDTSKSAPTPYVFPGSKPISSAPNSTTGSTAPYVFPGSKPTSSAPYSTAGSAALQNATSNIHPQAISTPYSISNPQNSAVNTTGSYNFASANNPYSFNSKSSITNSNDVHSDLNTAKVSSSNDSATAHTNAKSNSKSSDEHSISSAIDSDSPSAIPHLDKNYLQKQQTWKLEESDMIPPKFKPGSVNDNDYKDFEDSIGNGLYTSYGIPIPEDFTNHSDDEDDDHSQGKKKKSGNKDNHRKINDQDHPIIKSEHHYTPIKSDNHSTAAINNSSTYQSTEGNDDMFTTPTKKQSYQRYEPPVPGSAESVPKKSILLSTSNPKKINNTNVDNNTRRVSMNYPMPAGSHIQLNNKVNSHLSGDNRHVIFGENEVELFKDIASPAELNEDINNITQNISLLDLKKDSFVRSNGDLDGDDNDNDDNDHDKESNNDNTTSMLLSNTSINTNTNINNNLNNNQGMNIIDNQPTSYPPYNQINNQANYVNNNQTSSHPSYTIPTYSQPITNPSNYTSNTITSFSSTYPPANQSSYPPMNNQFLNSTYNFSNSNSNNESKLNNEVNDISAQNSISSNQSAPETNLQSNYISNQIPMKQQSYQQSSAYTTNYSSYNFNNTLSQQTNPETIHLPIENNITNHKPTQLPNLMTNQLFSDQIVSPKFSPPASTLDMTYLHVPPGTTSGGFYRPPTNNVINEDEDIDVDNKPFDWSLTFFRLKCLENPFKSLDKLFENDELYELAEIFASTLQSNDLNESDKQNDENSNDDEDEEDGEYIDGKQNILPTLQLLYYYKKYNQMIIKNPNYTTNLNSEDLIISNLITNINEVLNIQLTGFFTKISKVIQKYKFAMHLFSPTRQLLTRPFANDMMRKIFGPMCDSPSPKEYIDSSTELSATQELLDAFKEGRDAMIGVVCRTLRGGKPPSLLCVKALKDQNNQHLYSLIVYLDMSVETSESDLKKLNNVLKAFP